MDQKGNKYIVKGRKERKNTNLSKYGRKRYDLSLSAPFPSSSFSFSSPSLVDFLLFLLFLIKISLNQNDILIVVSGQNTATCNGEQGSVNNFISQAGILGPFEYSECNSLTDTDFFNVGYSLSWSEALKQSENDESYLLASGSLQIYHDNDEIPSYIGYVYVYDYNSSSFTPIWHQKYKQGLSKEIMDYFDINLSEIRIDTHGMGTLFFQLSNNSINHHYLAVGNSLKNDFVGEISIYKVEPQVGGGYTFNNQSEVSTLPNSTNATPCQSSSCCTYGFGTSMAFSRVSSSPILAVGQPNMRIDDPSLDYSSGGILIYQYDTTKGLFKLTQNLTVIIQDTYKDTDSNCGLGFNVAMTTTNNTNGISYTYLASNIAGSTIGSCVYLYRAISRNQDIHFKQIDRICQNFPSFGRRLEMSIESYQSSTEYVFLFIAAYTRNKVFGYYLPVTSSNTTFIPFSNMKNGLQQPLVKGNYIASTGSYSYFGHGLSLMTKTEPPGLPFLVISNTGLFDNVGGLYIYNIAVVDGTDEEFGGFEVNPLSGSDSINPLYYGGFPSFGYEIAPLFNPPYMTTQNLLAIGAPWNAKSSVPIDNPDITSLCVSYPGGIFLLNVLCVTPGYYMNQATKSCTLCSQGKYSTPIETNIYNGITYLTSQNCEQCPRGNLSWSLEGQTECNYVKVIPIQLPYSTTKMNHSLFIFIQIIVDFFVVLLFIITTVIFDLYWNYRHEIQNKKQAWFALIHTLRIVMSTSNTKSDAFKGYLMIFSSLSAIEIITFILYEILAIFVNKQIMIWGLVFIFIIICYRYLNLIFIKKGYDYCLSKVIYRKKQVTEEKNGITKSYSAHELSVDRTRSISSHLVEEESWMDEKLTTPINEILNKNFFGEEKATQMKIQSIKGRSIIKENKELIISFNKLYKQLVVFLILLSVPKFILLSINFSQLIEANKNLAQQLQSQSDWRDVSPTTCLFGNYFANALMVIFISLCCLQYIPRILKELEEESKEEINKIQINTHIFTIFQNSLHTTDDKEISAKIFEFGRDLEKVENDKIDESSNKVFKYKLKGHGGIEVAAKQIQWCMDLDGEFVKSEKIEEIKHELKILLYLRHHNIPIFYGISFIHERDSDGMLRLNGYLIQELCDEANGWTTLQKYIDDIWSNGNKPKGLTEHFLTIIFEIVTTVKFLHNEKRMVHRDIKPQNILIQPGREGEGLGERRLPKVKLIDFGISKVFSAEEENILTTDEEIQSGTPFYRAPETYIRLPGYQDTYQDQFPYNEKKFGFTELKHTDIFALATVFYFMWSGQTPFQHLYPGNIGDHDIVQAQYLNCKRTPFLKLLQEKNKNKWKEINIVYPWQKRSDSNYDPSKISMFETHLKSNRFSLKMRMPNQLVPLLLKMFSVHFPHNRPEIVVVEKILVNIKHELEEAKRRDGVYFALEYHPEDLEVGEEEGEESNNNDPFSFSGSRSTQRSSLVDYTRQSIAHLSNANQNKRLSITSIEIPLQSRQSFRFNDSQNRNSNGDDKSKSLLNNDQMKTD